MSIRKYQTGSGESRWQVEYRLPGRIKRRKVFRSAKEARLFEAEVVASKARGTLFNPRAGVGVTVELAWRSWLASRTDLRPKTRSGYDHVWSSSVKPSFGAWPLGDVTREAIQSWVNSMTVSPRTQRWHAGALKMCLEHAVAEGWLARNPATGVNFPPLRTRSHDYLSIREVEHLAELCGPQGDVVQVLSLTGLRWGELAGLTVEDVDLAARRLRVRRSVTFVPGAGMVETEPKTRAGRRSVPLAKSLVPLLKRRIEGRPPSAWAFTSPRGGQLNVGNWRRDTNFNVNRERIGHPRLRIHDLRHTAASLSISAGANVKAVQRMLGHSSGAMTLDVYADLFEDDLTLVADSLDNLITSNIDVPSDDSEQDGPLEAHCDGQLTIDDELIEDENQG